MSFMKGSGTRPSGGFLTACRGAGINPALELRDELVSDPVPGACGKAWA